MLKLDVIDALAIVLITLGGTLFVYGIYLDPPASMRDLLLIHFGDWTPGFVTDGVLLLIINRVIHSNEQRRVISQVASLSNEFALDAVRRCRDEGWLVSGVMRHRSFDGARLTGTDLSDARLPGTSFRFADLSGSDLTHADLEGVDLTGANLRDADLRWASLDGGCLQWADLRGAQIEGASLSGTDVAYASIDAHHRTGHELNNAIEGGYLTERQVQLIHSSFERFKAMGESATLKFYDRIFDAAPEVRPMFPDDIARQARKFSQALHVIVSSLNASDQATRMLHRLGERHLGYGVKAEHYPVVSAALLATLEDALGDEFDAETRQAWTDAIDLIASAMISAAESVKKH